MKILDLNDRITADTFVRSLTPSGGSERVNDSNPYGGAPVNSLLWVPVVAIYGGHVLGRKVKKVVQVEQTTGFGSHRDTMSHYRTLDTEFAVDVPTYKQLRGLEEHLAGLLHSTHAGWGLAAPVYRCPRCRAPQPTKPQSYVSCGCGSKGRWEIVLDVPRALAPLGVLTLVYNGRNDDSYELSPADGNPDRL